jgi:hypothetical protein
MYRKKNRAVRETQYSGGTGLPTDGYKACRKSFGLYWESEGFIVPFEAKGQHNPGRGKEPYFVQATKERRVRRLRNANNSK